MMRSFGAKVIPAATLLVCGLLSGCGEKPPTDAGKTSVRADESWPNVVLISIDTLRRDHVGCYGYSRATSPNIDRLASDGAVFENMISSSSWTLPAHASMMTGLADSVHGAVETDTTLAGDRVTLAERLAAAGYETAGFFSGPTLHPAYGLGQGFNTYVDCTAYAELSAESARQGQGIEVGGALQKAAMTDVSSPRVYAAVHEWLARGPRRPFFLFVHLYDPHFDFIPPPPYDTRFDPDYAGTATGKNFIFDEAINAKMPPRDLEHIVALYDGEIAWTDEHVGRILDDLDALKLRDRTVVIVLADHGVEFFEHQGKGHRQTLFDEVIRIPLIVSCPLRLGAGQRPAVQARMVDVVPTVLDLVGLPPAADVMGHSLVPALKGGQPQGETLAVSELYSLGRSLQSFRRVDRKLIADARLQQTMVFNLRTDPGEQAPMGDAQNVLAQAAHRDADLGRKWLASFLQSMGQRGMAPNLPDRVRRHLESLGYLRGSEDRPGGE